MESRDNILIVDDLAINRQVLESYLSMDYETVAAAGGKEALDLIEDHEFEIALLDVNMPVMSGFELADNIREIPKYSELPILFITGAALDQEFIVKGLSIGTVDYLCKPFDLKVLLLKVQNFISLNKKTKKLQEEISVRKESELKLMDSLSREKQLSEKLKLSERMEAIGRLASGISHDFNNLMTALTSHAEFLKHKIPEENRHLHAILNICDTGIDISDKLKVFSRNRSPRKKVFDLCKLISDLEEMCDVTLEANIQQEFSIHDQKIKVLGSTSEIQNALLNLIINARDAIKSNGTISVSCSRQELDDSFCKKLSDSFEVQPGSYARITISDTGDGMDEDTTKKIFEPFFSTKKDKGTGLGLVSVYQTVREHLGCIEVFSTLGKGTEFHVYLKEELQSSDDENKQKRLDVDLTGVRILVIDDNEHVLESTAIVLKASGAGVDCFRSPEEALTFYKEQKEKINLVITDHILPNMNGDELASKMKKVNPDLKILILTGICDQDKVSELAEKSEFVLTKPFHNNDLLSKVAQCLKVN